jgi:hypothetical protein
VGADAIFGGRRMSMAVIASIDIHIRVRVGFT